MTELLAHTLGGLVKLEWTSDDGVWSAFADSAQLELALMNPIINARDAMPKGGTIAVRARNARALPDNKLALPAGDYVVFAVSDDGSGIPPEILEQVTEPSTIKDVGEGTGLGPSMVYGFARQSGGALDIDLTVRVRRSRSAAVGTESRRGKAAPAKQTPTPPVESAPLRILLVDDHEAVRETTAGLLQDMGHQAETAHDGPAMLEKLKAGRPATTWSSPIMPCP